MVPVAGQWCKVILRMRKVIGRENGKMEVCPQFERDVQIPSEACFHPPYSYSFKSSRNKGRKGVIFSIPLSADLERLSWLMNEKIHPRLSILAMILIFIFFFTSSVFVIHYIQLCKGRTGNRKRKANLGSHRRDRFASSLVLSTLAQAWNPVTNLLQKYVSMWMRKMSHSGNKNE